MKNEANHMLTGIKVASDIIYSVLITVFHNISEEFSSPSPCFVGIGAISTPCSRIDTDWWHFEPDFRFKNGFHSHNYGINVAY